MYELRYDQICKNSSSVCIVTLHIDHDIQGKVALLYKLSGYYQNHRKIFNSKNYDQLAGKYLSTYSDLSSCSPAISEDDSSNPNSLYIPCGLMALSFFSDHYKWINTSVANFSDENISQSSERDLFKPINLKYKNGIRILINNSDFPGETTNEHFIIWMRAAALPDFLKVFAKCHNCFIPKGDYQIKIQMKYPDSMFHGSRYIYLISSGKTGTCPKFLWMSFLISGGTSLLLTIIFYIQNLICQESFMMKNNFSELILEENQITKNPQEIQLQMISENN